MSPRMADRFVWPRSGGGFLNRPRDLVDLCPRGCQRGRERGQENERDIQSVAKEVPMPFMLKIQWDIKAGGEADFRDNQAALCKVMLEHPGVICYHIDYPSQRVSQWTEIYA